MPNAASFFGKTPREIRMELTAFAAREQNRRLENWLLGKYIAFAVHDPAHYPLPPATPNKGADMSDEEMKQRLLAMRGKDENI